MMIASVNISANDSIDEARRKLGEISWELAREWFTDQVRNAFAHYHLYYRPSNAETPGQLNINTEQPEGFQLAHTQRLSTAWTVENAQAFIHQAMRNLPILPTC
jgi:hypothetical protein